MELQRFYETTRLKKTTKYEKFCKFYMILQNLPDSANKKLQSLLKNYKVHIKLQSFKENYNSAKYAHFCKLCIILQSFKKLLSLHKTTKTVIISKFLTKIRKRKRKNSCV